MKQLLDLLGDVESFLQRPEEFSTTTRSKLLVLFNDQQKISLLKLELAAVIDFGESFVNATYGDGPLSFKWCLHLLLLLILLISPISQLLVHYSVTGTLPLCSN